MTHAVVRRSLVFAAVVFALVAIPTASYASHAWSTYHWARTSNPFTLKMGDNVSGTWDPYLAEASSDWSASSVLDTTVVAGGTKPKSCRPTSGQIEVCSSSYGNTGWLGVAQIWLSGGHIAQATTKVNDYYHNSAPYNRPEWRRLVMCQEIGHDFGLDHQDENFNNGNLGTCMDYTSDPLGPPSNEHPNKHDYDQLAAIYSHLDSTTTVAASTVGAANGALAGASPAFLDMVPETPNQWGQLVAMSEDGGQAVFELDFGNGYKIVTHVTWTLEMADQMIEWRDSLGNNLGNTQEK